MKDAQNIKMKTQENAATMLRAPEAFFTHMYARKAKGIQMGILLIAGMTLTALLAQGLSIGKLYPIGRIVSGIFVLGPFLGLLFFLLAGLAGFWACNFLDPKVSLELKYQKRIPPFPFKRLLFERLVSKERFDRIFEFPVLKQYLNLWSWLRSFFQYVRVRFGRGPTSFGYLFSMLNKAIQPMFLAAMIAWASLFWGNQRFLMAEENLFPILAFLLQLALTFWCIALWSKALKIVYALNNAKAFAIGIGSFGFATVTLIGFVSFLVGIPLF